MISADKAMDYAFEYAERAGLPKLFITIYNLEKSESGNEWVATIGAAGKRYEAKIDIETGALVEWKEKK